MEKSFIEEAFFEFRKINEIMDDEIVDIDRSLRHDYDITYNGNEEICDIIDERGSLLNRFKSEREESIKESNKYYDIECSDKKKETENDKNEKN
jgi:hypothetical protein